MKSFFRFFHRRESHAAQIPLTEAGITFSGAEELIQRGNRLEDLGDSTRACELYQQAVTLSPNFAPAHLNVGNAMALLGQNSAAINSYLRAIELNPDHAGSHLNLGNVLFTSQAFDKAADSYRQAIRLRSNWAEAWVGLGRALEMKSALPEAIAACRQALAYDPTHAGAVSNLANWLRQIGQAGAAKQILDAALVNDPNNVWLLRGQAWIDGGIGEYDAAIANYRRVLELEPDDFASYSNLLWTLNFVPDISPEALLAEHQQFGERLARKSRMLKPLVANLSKKRLRIGYVSPDFRRHSVSCFVESLLRNHNRQLVEVHCFYDCLERDDVTRRLIELTDRWHDIGGLNDDDVAQEILANQIDILIDLTGHTANNRLRVFACKPAPIQFTWLGYLCTTGVATIDYRLCDFHTDPENVAEHWQVEKPVRLPDSQWCYQPQVELPQHSDLPMLTNGYCTFGSFNQESKLNSKVLQAWGGLLTEIADSRLRILGVTCDLVEKRIRNSFAAQGIAAERVELVERIPIDSYFNCYREVDIALDTFPYTGATTTCDALIMGVPVATVAGQRSIARSGVSLLTTLGLREWIAPAAEALVEMLRVHTADPLRLAGLRAKLPEMIRISPLMDGPLFARNVEAAFQHAWERWCLAQTTRNLQASCSSLGR